MTKVNPWHFDRSSVDTTIDGFFWMDTMAQTVTIGTKPCASNGLLRLNSIRMDKVCLMRRMIKDFVDMHISIRAMSSMSGNWVPLHPSS